MSVRTWSSISNRHETDIIRKTHFFHAIDTWRSTTLKEIYEHEHVLKRTRRYWLRQRFILDDAVNRRTEKHRSDRKIKISDVHLNQLLSRTNPVRDHHYECQIDHFNLNVSSRTLRRALTSRRNARMYKTIIVRRISDKNKRLRVEYEEHKIKSLKFSYFIHWTDEAHIDLSKVSSQYILREKDTRYEFANVK